MRRRIKKNSSAANIGGRKKFGGKAEHYEFRLADDFGGGLGVYRNEIHAERQLISFDLFYQLIIYDFFKAFCPGYHLY